MNRHDRREARLHSAGERYAHALHQARVAPSMHTKRELKRADNALKRAKMPFLYVLLPACILVAASLLLIIIWVANHTEGGSTGWNEAEKRATEECQARLMQTLDEAGSDRPLTEAERKMCADPEQRKFLGLE